MEKYGAGSIVVSEYDPTWPALFEQERARIKHALGSFALVIEHVGSTAVPGLPSKPIIDLLIGVLSLEEARERCIAPLEAIGYIYMPEYASWLPDELFFRKGPPGQWTHHVHVIEPSRPRWEALLVFRDYLRAHPEAARAYANVKRGWLRRQTTTSRPIEPAKMFSSRTRRPRLARGAQALESISSSAASERREWCCSRSASRW